MSSDREAQWGMRVQHTPFHRESCSNTCYWSNDSETQRGTDTCQLSNVFATQRDTNIGHLPHDFATQNVTNIGYLPHDFATQRVTNTGYVNVSKTQKGPNICYSMIPKHKMVTIAVRSFRTNVRHSTRNPIVTLAIHPAILKHKGVRTNTCYIQ